MSNPATKWQLRLIVSVVRPARWAVCGALVTAACGSLYGLLFSSLASLLQSELWGIGATASYFAVCGVVAGALLGAFGAMVSDHGRALDDDVALRVEVQPPCARTTGDMASAVWRPVNRLAELPTVNRRRIELASSNSPSRN
jgi:hypothetical protein